MLTLNLRPGAYRHFKGKLYHVIGVAKHVDTPEEFVVYRPLYGNQSLVVRPASVFMETVTIDGTEVARFEFVGESKPPDFTESQAW